MSIEHSRGCRYAKHVSSRDDVAPFARSEFSWTYLLPHRINENLCSGPWHGAQADLFSSINASSTGL